VDAVAVAPEQVLAGGQRGTYRSTDILSWTPSANQSTTDLVTVPDTWLLCSAEHDIRVVRGDATRGD
jgi:hypothetical protein